MMKYFLITVAVAFLFSGCKPVDPLAKVDIVIIDGEPLTAAEVRDSVLLQASIREACGKKIKEAEFKKWANSTSLRIIPQLIANRLIGHELDSLGMRRTDESDRVVLSRYGKKLMIKPVSVEDVARRFGSSADRFRMQFDFESRLEAYYLSLTEKLAVSDEELTEKEAADKEDFRKISLLNDEITARGYRAWTNLNNGVSWEQTSKEYNEDALLDPSHGDYWQMWDDVPLSTPYYLPTVADAVRSLKEGEYTKPLDTEEGMVIVKTLKRNENTVSCARILLRMHVLPTVLSGEDLRRQMEQESRAQYQRVLLKSLHNKAKMEYPMGERITYEIF